MSRVFHLKFNKEADGDWYIDFPGYPFAHHNLMMVAGANQLCAYVAEKEGHPRRAVVDVTINDHLLDGRVPDITMERFDMGYGADVLFLGIAHRELGRARGRGRPGLALPGYPSGAVPVSEEDQHLHP